MRMRKVLAKAYTRRTRPTLSLWREYVSACHPGPQEAMEARQKQARSLLPRGRPGCACTCINARQSPPARDCPCPRPLRLSLVSDLSLQPRPATLPPREPTFIVVPPWVVKVLSPQAQQDPRHDRPSCRRLRRARLSRPPCFSTRTRLPMARSVGSRRRKAGQPAMASTCGPSRRRTRVPTSLLRGP